MFLKIILSVIFNTLIQTDTISLFNGKNLDGWKIHGTEKWYVNDGELICESGPDEQYGYLSTINSYKNFILTLDFYQESDGNSGAFFRSSIDGVKIWLEGGWVLLRPSNTQPVIRMFVEATGESKLAKIKKEFKAHFDEAVRVVS